MYEILLILKKKKLPLGVNFGSERVNFSILSSFRVSVGVGI